MTSFPIDCRSWNETVCQGDEYCGAGACVSPEPCEVGATRCSGAELERCDATGAWVFDSLCAAGCVDDEFSVASCALCACEAGSERCFARDGRQGVERCNEERAGWDEIQSCEDRVRCVDGSCVTR